MWIRAARTANPHRHQWTGAHCAPERGSRAAVAVAAGGRWASAGGWLAAGRGRGWLLLHRRVEVGRSAGAVVAARQDDHILSDDLCQVAILPSILILPLARLQAALDID